MEKYIEDFIISADAKALATYAEGNLNVIPVSSIKVHGGKIWLINYFMEKTLANIRKSNKVSLVCWRKMMGYQVKGEATYVTEGSEFEDAVGWIKELLPDRTVKGLIVITPHEVFDVSPAKDTKEKFIAE